MVISIAIVLYWWYVAESSAVCTILQLWKKKIKSTNVIQGISYKVTDNNKSDSIFLKKKAWLVALATALFFAEYASQWQIFIANLNLITKNIQA